MSATLDRADWLVLDENEEVLREARPSMYPVVPWALLGLVFVAAGVWLVRTGALPVDRLPDEIPYLQVVPLVLVPIGVVMAVVPYVRRWSIQYVLTDRGLYTKRGLFSRSVSQVRLDRVQNTAFEQGSMGRVLSYGDVRIYTAGSDRADLVLIDVADPQHVIRSLTDQLGDETEPTATEPGSPAGDDRSVL